MSGRACWPARALPFVVLSSRIVTPDPMSRRTERCRLSVLQTRRPSEAFRIVMTLISSPAP